MKKMIQTISLVAASLFLFAVSGRAQGQHHGGDRGADMNTIHAMFDAHKSIKRSVKNIENGVEAVTESEDPKIAALIKEHTHAMKARLEKKQPIRAWDPLFAALFENAEKIKLDVTDTPKGVKITETSSDPYIVKLIQAHAVGVTEFVNEGTPAMPRRHELPAAPEKPEKTAQGFMGKGDGVTTCPVTGQSVDKSISAKIDGRIMYFCCAACRDSFVQARATKVRSEMLVSTESLAKRLKEKDLVILHVARERKAYDEGHLPGARFLALGDILATRDGIPNELPPVETLQKVFAAAGAGNEGKIVIYGDNNGLSAARTYFTLDYLGHGARAALLDGGLEKWKAENRPLETQPPASVTLPFTPRLQPSIVAGLAAMRDLSWLASQLESPGVSLIDSRPEEQYLGNPAQRSGHLPGAAHVYWMNHLVSAADPQLKPVSQLRKLYEQAGLTTPQMVVAYCNTGIQASHTYFTLKYLGFDPLLYDASFAEWGKAADAPVVTGKNPK